MALVSRSFSANLRSALVGCSVSALLSVVYEIKMRALCEEETLVINGHVNRRAERAHVFGERSLTTSMCTRRLSAYGWVSLPSRCFSFFERAFLRRSRGHIISPTLITALKSNVTLILLRFCLLVLLTDDAPQQSGRRVACLRARERRSKHTRNDAFLAA